MIFVQISFFVLHKVSQSLDLEVIELKLRSEMGKPKDIAWGQVDIDPKNESVVCCKHCKAKLSIGSGRNQSVSAVKKHLKAQHFPVFSSLYPSKTSTNEDLPSISGTKRHVGEIDAGRSG